MYLARVDYYFDFRVPKILLFVSSWAHSRQSSKAEEVESDRLKHGVELGFIQRNLATSEI